MVQHEYTPYRSVRSLVLALSKLICGVQCLIHRVLASLLLYSLELTAQAAPGLTVARNAA